MKLSVLIPTYNRPIHLRRCLIGLAAQSRLPEEVVLIVRKDDHATLEAIAQWPLNLPAPLIRMSGPGQVNALNTGLAAASGDIVAITDDDAVPRKDWLERLEQHFVGDLSVGGVGGRDWVHHGSDVDNRNAALVGRIQWFGRMVGNHHIGSGPARDIDILKGANMSYRSDAVAGVEFDRQLRGKGAQVCNDLAFSLAIQRNGWRLVYDPKVAVDHYPAPRFDHDARGICNDQALEDGAFNLYWALLGSMSPGRRRLAACVWQTAVGSKAQPGLFYLLLGLLQRNDTILSRWKCVERGRKAARQLHGK